MSHTARDSLSHSRSHNFVAARLLQPQGAFQDKYGSKAGLARIAEWMRKSQTNATVGTTNAGDEIEIFCIVGVDRHQHVSVLKAPSRAQLP